MPREEIRFHYRDFKSPILRGDLPGVRYDLYDFLLQVHDAPFLELRSFAMSFKQIYYEHDYCCQYDRKKENKWKYRLFLFYHLS
jgi:hypothetical protein